MKNNRLNVSKAPVQPARRNTSRLTRAGTAAAAILATGILPPALTTPAQAQSNWLPTAGGTFLWGTGANWSAGVPDAIGANANFSLNYTLPQTIDLGGVNRTLGTLSLGDTGDSQNPYFANYRVYQQFINGSLTLDVASGSAALNKTTGSNFEIFNMGLTLNDSTVADIRDRMTVNFTGALTGASGVVLSRHLTNDQGGNEAGALIFSGSGTSFQGRVQLDTGTGGRGLFAFVGENASLGTAGQTALQVANGTLQLFGDNSTVEGNIVQTGGTINLDRNQTVQGNLTLSGGTFQQLGSFRTLPSVPTLALNGDVTVSGGTATFRTGTNIDSTGTFTVSGGTVNFEPTGTHIVNRALSISGGTVNVQNTTFSNGISLTGGTTRLSANVNLSGGLSITGGGAGITFTQDTGILQNGGDVTNTFNDGIAINGAGLTGTNTINASFLAKNTIGGNITISGNAQGFTGIGNTTEVTLLNEQDFTGTLNINGGRVRLQHSGGLGAAGGGVNISGEKSVLMFDRGIVSEVGENITFGPMTGAVTGVVITNGGTGYAAGGVTFTGGGGTGAAFGNTTVTAGAITAIGGVTNVGGGYTSSPTVNLAGGGTGATAVAVLSAGGVRLNDQHSIWNGNFILDNVSGGNVTVAPIVSVNGDDSLVINGDIYGSATVVTGPESRLLRTAALGSQLNSGAGFIILNGQVKDKVGGTATGVDVLRTDWGGNSELNILVNKEWGSNGLITVSSGVMRFTADNTVSNNFFGAGVTGALDLSTNDPSLIGYNAQSTNVAFFLTKAGQNFNTGGFTVRNGNTDRVTNAATGGDGTDTGNTTFGGENTSGTVTVGNGSGTIAIETTATAQTRDLRLFQNLGGTMDVTANIVDSGTGTSSISKIGNGTVRLLGSTAGAGTVERVAVLGGTLEMAGFATNNDQRTASNAVTTLGGGNLVFTGHAGGPTVHNMTGAVTVRNGGSAIAVNADPGVGNTFNANFGAITRNAGSTLQFVANGPNAVINTSGTASGILLGGLTGTSINSMTSFANVGVSGDVTPFTAYDASDDNTTWLTGDRVDEVNGFDGTIAAVANLNVDLIRFSANAAGSSIGTINMGTSTLTVDKGILLSSDASGNNRVITGGVLTSGATDLNIHNYGGVGGPTLTIASQITGTRATTISGTGTTFLTNATNSFTGNIHINGGTLSISNTAQLGNSGNDLFIDGGTLAFTATTTLPSTRDITVFGDRATLSVAPGVTATIQGRLFNEANVLANYGGANMWNGDLVIEGGGTLFQSNNANNSINGSVLIRGGTNFTLETGVNGSFGGSGGNDIRSYTSLDAWTIESGSTLEARLNGNFGITRHLFMGGSGVGGNGALRVTRPTSAGFDTLTDRDSSWTGPITLTSDTTVFIDDQPEGFNRASQMAFFRFNDTILTGNGHDLTKTGNGVLVLVNSRIENLPTININGGEVRIEGGMTGSLGNTETGLNYTTGTTTINLNGNIASNYEVNPRLFINDHRAEHTTDINLSGGYFIVNSTADAPLPSVDFSGTINLTGPASANAIEVRHATRANPAIFSGAITGTGGFTKASSGTMQIVNANNTFSGELVLNHNSYSANTPGVGLYNQGRLTNVSNISLLHGARFFIDNTSNIDGTATFRADNNRINDAATLTIANGSQFRIIGNGTTAVSEDVAKLNVLRGSSAIEFDTMGSQNISLGFVDGTDSFDRQPGGVVEFRALQQGVTIGTATGPNTVNIRLGSALSASEYVGSAGTGSTRSVVVGAFGGSAVYNSTVNSAGNGGSDFINAPSERGNIGRHFMTVENSGGIDYLRPLILGTTPATSEYFTIGTGASTLIGPITPNIAVVPTANQDFTFDSTFNTGGTDHNVRLIGGFGDFDSYFFTQPANVAGVTQPPNSFQNASDTRPDQYSVHRVTGDVTVNSLSFGQHVDAFRYNSSNRVVLEIGAGKTFTVSSGMILNAPTGNYSQLNESFQSNITLQNFIRGEGTLSFAGKEAIIHNSGTYLREASNGVGGQNLEIFANIADTGGNGLTKSGDQVVVLAGRNTYTGPTRIVQGELRAYGNNAFGASSEIIVTGNGSLGLQQGAVINGVTLRATGNANDNFILINSDNGYNVFGGDIIIDTQAANGGQPFNNGRFVVQQDSVLRLNGTIYGTAGTNQNFDLFDSKFIRFNEGGGAGVIDLAGTFQDTATGAIGSVVDTTNENQVLRATIDGNNEFNFMVRNPWNSAGRIFFRQGVTRFTGEGGSTFWTADAASKINPANGQSQSILNDSGGRGDVAILLTGNGQSFNSPNIALGNGTTDGSVTIGHEGVFGGGTATFFTGNATFANNWDRSMRLLANGDSTVVVQGRITDGSQGHYVKIGRGTVRLVGALGASTNSNNDFDRGLVLAGGELVLDAETNYGGTGALNNPWGNPTAGLTFGGGTLRFIGKSEAGGTNQTYGLAAGSGNFSVQPTDPRAGHLVLALRPGGSEFIVESQSTRTTTMTLRGSFFHVDTAQVANVNGGGTLNFVEINNGGTASIVLNPNVITTGHSMGATNQIVGPWATYGNAAGQASDFAFRANTTNDLITLAAGGIGTTQDNPSAWAAGQYITDSAGFTGGTAVSGVKTIRFNAASGGTLNLPSSFVLGNGTDLLEGAILVTNNVTAPVTIAGNTIGTFATPARNLYLHNYGTGGVTVSSGIVGAQNVVFAGSGTTTLTGANTYTGKTFLNGGTVVIDSDSKLGVAPGALVADQLTINGGGLRITGTTTFAANRGIIIGGDGATLNIDAGTVTTFGSGSNVIASETNPALQASTAAATPPAGSLVARNPFAGDLIKTGNGTLVFGILPALNTTTLNPNNTYTGLTDLQAGKTVVRGQPGNNATITPFGASYSFADGTIVRSGATLEFSPIVGDGARNGEYQVPEWLVLEGGSTLRAFNRTLRLEGGGLAITGTTVLDNASTVRFHQNFDAAGGFITGTGDLHKVNGGTLEIRTGGDWSGNLFVNRGQVNTPSVATLNYVNSFTTIRNGILSLSRERTESETLNDSAALNLHGRGRLILASSENRTVANVATQETIGPVNVGSGNPTIEFETFSTTAETSDFVTRPVTLRAASLTKSAGAALHIRANDYQVTFGTGDLSQASAHFSVNTAPTLTGAGSTGSPNRGVVPGVFSGNYIYSYLPGSNAETSFTGRRFVTTEQNGGVHYLRPLLDSEYQKVQHPAGNANGTLSLTGALAGSGNNLMLTGISPDGLPLDGFTVGALGNVTAVRDHYYNVSENLTLNTLTFQGFGQSGNIGGGSAGAAAGLRIHLNVEDGRSVSIAGGIQFANGGRIVHDTNSYNADTLILGNGRLDFGSNEIQIRSQNVWIRDHSANTTDSLNGSDAFIVASLAGTNGLVKSGPQNLWLRGRNAYSGTTYVTEGFLLAQSEFALGDPSSAAKSTLVHVNGTGQFAIYSGAIINHADVYVGALAGDVAVLNNGANGNNHGVWGGDVIIDNLDFANAAIFRPIISSNDNTALTITGDVYGGPTAITSNTDITDARLVQFRMGAGVINLKGNFRDTVSGALASPVTTANENQVLVAEINGNNDEGNLNVFQKWDAAGQIQLERGYLRYAGSGDFYSAGAANAMNVNNTQSGLVLGGNNAGTTSTLGLLLTANGQSLNIPSIQVGAEVVTSGNEFTGSFATGGQPNPSLGNITGNSTLGGEVTSGSTVSIGTGTGTILIAGQPNPGATAYNRDLRLFAQDAGGTVNINARIADGGTTVNSSITKVGLGDVNLNGSTAGAGSIDAVNAVGGRLNLTNYGTNNNSRFSGTGTMTLAGGIVSVTNDTAGAVVEGQTTGLTIRAGNSGVQTLNSGAGSTTVNLGAITRFSGGSANFTEVGTSSITITGIGAAGNRIGSHATYATSTTAVEDWAASDGSNGVQGFAGYTANSFTGASDHTNISTDSAFGAASSVGSVRFNSGSALDLSLDGFALTIATGGVLVPTSSGGTFTISGTAGSSVTSGFSSQRLAESAATSNDLLLHNYSTVDPGLSVTVPLVNNGSTRVNLVHAGSGKTVLGAVNTYSGMTHLNGGVVEIAAESALGTVDTTIGQVLILNPGAGYTAAPALTFGGTTATGATTITGGRVTAFTITAGGVIATNSGALTLGFTAAPTGGTTATGYAVPNGSLWFDGGTLRVAPPVAGTTVTINDDRAIILGGDGGTIEVVGNSTNNNTVAFNGLIASDSNASSSHAGGGLGGNPFVGNLTKTGDGILQIAPTNAGTFQGLTTVAAGVLRLAGGNVQHLGTNIGFADGTVVNAGATLWFAHSAETNTNEFITLNGHGVTNSLDNTADVDTAVNLTDNNGHSWGAIYASGSTVNLNGVINIASDITVNAASTIRFNNGGGFVTGAGSIVKAGDNQLAFSESNPDWTGSLTVLRGNVVGRGQGLPFGSGTQPFILGDDVLPTTAANTVTLWLLPEMGTNGTGVGSAAPIDVMPQVVQLNQDIIVNAEAPGGSAQQTKRLGTQNGVYVNGDRLVYNGAITLNDDVQLLVQASNGETLAVGEQATVYYNGAISGPSDINAFVDQTGGGNGADNDLTGIAILGGDNSAWTGRLIVNTQTTGADSDERSVVRVANNNALSSSNRISLNGGGTLQVGGSTVTVGSLQAVAGSAGTNFIENASEVAGSITIHQTDGDGTPNEATVFAGVIRDGVTPSVFKTSAEALDSALSIVKSGDDTLTLSAANTYTGTTTVNEGTLLVTGSISGSTSSVNTGGTLGGTGTLGPVLVNGGTLAPGMSAGTLTTGNLSFSATSTFSLELSDASVPASNDFLQVNGNLTLDGTLAVTELAGFTGESFLFAAYTGILTDNIIEIDPVFQAAHPFAYVDTSIAGQVYLQAVPEPGTALSLLGGMGVLLGLRRRRRS